MKKSIFKISIIIISVFAFCKSINAYTMGEKVKYKGNKYYVINDNNTSVTLLKERPLTTVEVNTYGEGHINAYSKFDDSSLEVSYEHEAVDIDGYGAIAFYQSDTCKLSDEEVSDGCKNTYIDSDIKYVIDVWAKDNVDEEDLVSDSTGYTVRLLTFDETTNYLGFEYRSNHVTLPKAYMETADTPKWVYNTSYWLMTPSEDNTKVYYMTDGGVLKESASLSPNLIRPVITLSKKSLDSKNTKKTYILNNDINEIKYGISYNIGDTIIYNDINFTVIKNSTDADDSILLIKDEPLTVDEIVKNGTGYINKAFGNPPNSVNGYGMVSYYSSDTCNHTDNSGCTNKYEDSDAKHILDTWVSNSLKNDNINILDLNARIISKSDLFDIFGYTISSASQQSSSSGPSLKYVPPVPTDYDLSYCLTSYSIFDGSISVFSGNSENIYQAKHVTYPGAICPIISIKKQFIKKDSNDIVNVPDTKLYKGFMILLSGIVIILLSIVLLFIRKKKVIVKNEKK